MTSDDPRRGRHQAVRRLDASAQNGGLTGREILTLAQKTMGLRAGRVDEMLDLVSLTEGRPDDASAMTRSACASGGRGRLVLIGKARIMAQGTKGELLASIGTQSPVGRAAQTPRASPTYYLGGCLGPGPRPSRCADVVVLQVLTR